MVMTGYKVIFLNSKTGEAFTLPTVYTDYCEALFKGQEYCRDRMVEDKTSLFFRIMEAEVKEEEKIDSNIYQILCDLDFI